MFYSPDNSSLSVNSLRVFFLCVACVAFDSRMSARFNPLKQTILDTAHANLMCLSSPHDLNLFTLTQFGTGRKDTQNVSGMNKITHSIWIGMAHVFLFIRVIMIWQTCGAATALHPWTHTPHRKPCECSIPHPSLNLIHKHSQTHKRQVASHSTINNMAQC